MKKIKVVGERILVKMHVVEKEELTQGGLIIETDNTEAKTHVVGTVVQLGKGDFQVKEGDTIFYGKHAGIDFEHDDVVYTLLRSQDIFAVYTGEDKKSINKSSLKGLDENLVDKIRKNSL